MSCLGLLYKVRNSENPNAATSSKFKFHINYWKLPKKHWGYERFMDFGIMMEGVSDIESIVLYVPFKIYDKNNVKDLGESLASNGLLSVLFNDNYEVTPSAQFPSYCDVQPKSTDTNKKSFWLYQLNTSNFKVRNLTVGSCVEIKLLTKPNFVSGIKERKGKEEKHEGEHEEANEENRDLNIYIRFRIEGLNDKSMSYTEDISNDFIQSAFSKTEIMNLHVNAINEIRKEDYQVLASEYGFCDIETFHFFFVGSTTEESVFGTKEYADTRLFEPYIWNKYIGEHNPKNRLCLAYHWKVDKPQKTHNVYLRTIYSAFNFKKVLKYSSVVIFLGAVGSFLATLIGKYIFGIG